MVLTFKTFAPAQEPTEDQVLTVLTDTQLELNPAEIALKLAPLCGVVNEICLAERLRALHNRGLIQRRRRKPMFFVTHKHIVRER